MKRKRTIITIAVLSMFFTAVFSLSATEIGREDRIIAPFSKLDIETAGKVFITQGEVQGVTIVGSNRLRSKIETKVHRDTLYIDADLGFWGNRVYDTKDLEIYITITDLTELEFQGVGKVEGTDLHLGDLEIDFEGVGDFFLSGTVNRLDVDSQGVGRLNLSELQAEHVTLSQEGVGEVSLYASQSLSIKATGIGRVTYTGEVEDVTIRSTGIGGVTRVE